MYVEPGQPSPAHGLHLSHGGTGMASLSAATPYARVKRGLDLLGAGLLLLALLPLFGLLVVLIRADGGPGLFRHQRVGRGGRLFWCYKFRSMRMDADAVLAALLASNHAARQEWQARQKLAQDPRVTPLGRFLRSTSLDELPQLLNVLNGEMSLVGPRPVTARELLARYGDGSAWYLSVRPGITGLWQVSGRSTTSYEERVELDVRYAMSLSFRTDLLVLLRTPWAVLRRRGAC